MATNTSPDNIPAPTSTDQISPLATWFQGLATGVQNALNNITRYGGMRAYGSSAARAAAIPSPIDGQRVWRTDLRRIERWYANSNPATWFQYASVPTHRRRAAAMDLNNANGTTPILWDTLVNGPNVPEFNYNATTGMFTCIRPGSYSVKCLMSLEQSGFNVGYLLRLLRNGDNVADVPNVTSTTSATSTFISHDVNMAAGDTLQLVAFANLAAPGIGTDEMPGRFWVQITFLGDFT